MSDHVRMMGQLRPITAKGMPMLKEPKFAPAYFIEWQPGFDQKDMVTAGLRWLSQQPNGKRGVFATDAAHGLDLLPKAVVRSCKAIHVRNTGIGTSAVNRPILALFPQRDPVLKLTSQQLDRAEALCVLTYGPNDVPFINHWLDRIRATNLVDGQQRRVNDGSALDPVVEAAFSSLRHQLTRQLRPTRMPTTPATTAQEP
jgi:hypothetical protein